MWDPIIPLIEAFKMRKNIYHPIDTGVILDNFYHLPGWSFFTSEKNIKE